MGNAEFDLISRIRARLGSQPGVVLGIGDDAALLAVPPGMQLVVTADTLNAGVHFPESTAAVDIGWKALAVNLSDLAAMGATPAWCTLSLSLPQIEENWIDGFLDGFLGLANLHGMALVGGDTTRGPLSISVTAMGLVEPGNALRRDGAQPGDDIWVTGTLGDAAFALRSMRTGEPANDHSRLRLDRPTPRVDAGLRLRGLAHACVDLSDGLLADLTHVCERSSVAAEVQLGALPTSPGLYPLSPADRWTLQACAGDDYELCFTATPRHRELILQAMDFAGVDATRIGRIVSGQGVRGFDDTGAEWRAAQTGYQHFA